ncbi:MAG: DUF3800 domain-containing protein [Thaumarchaeota archaeon]|nr:DUF3800 domain-containing protein [Nitrososphaerota archaeon]
MGFSDESHTEQGCWTSIGMVTMKKSSLEQLEKELREELQPFELKSEIKWTNTKKGWGSKVARAICDFIVKKATKYELRIDTIIVDKKYMSNKDKKENISKIYYSLLKNVLECRWCGEHVWDLYADENKSMWWEKLKFFLEHNSTQWFQTADGMELRKMFDIYQISPRKSQSSIFLQVADIFAGMAVFSRSYYDEYESWPGPNRTLDDTKHYEPKKHFRFNLLRQFNLNCKNRKLGVSLKSTRGLHTPDPKKPINFWLYVAKTNSHDNAYF